MGDAPTSRLTLVDSERPEDTHQRRLVTADFSARLVDNFFQRWLWMVAIVVPFGLIGLLSSQNIVDEYVSDGKLSASANPLVDQVEVRGTTINVFESPAAGTARLFNEQLRTDSFVDDIARRAGLADQIEQGLIGRQAIRERVAASASGDNLLTVSARWTDSATAFLLVDSTIAGYLDNVVNVVAQDSDDAVRFLDTVRASAVQRVGDAETALSNYLTQLGPRTNAQGYTAAEELTIDRLNGAINRALDDVNDADRDIDGARVNVEQARSDAFRLVRVVDPPDVPAAPEPNRLRRVIAVLMFTLVGVVVAFAALTMATALDRTIRSSVQLGVAAGTDVTVALPRVRIPSQSAPPEADDPPIDGGSPSSSKQAVAT